MLTYDADKAPNIDAWQALEDPVREAVILRAHNNVDDRLHPPGRPMHLHVGMHLTVENLAATEDASVVRTLDRLSGQGLRRHAAVHMIIDVLMARFVDQMKGEAWSDTAFAAALDRLNAGDWLGAKMRNDLGAVDL